MKLHEYQAKQIFSQYGIPVPLGDLALDPAQAAQIAAKLGKPVVIKAQIHAGGRGRAGGIKIAHDPAQASQLASELLGTRLITHQTGPAGKLVSKLLIEELLEIQREYYLGITIDRSRNKQRLVMIASSEGGMEIEEIAQRFPQKLIKVWIDPGLGFSDFQARKLGYGLDLPKQLIPEFSRIARALYRVFLESDALLAEINPLVLSSDGRLVALDAKLELDEDALYRHPELAQLRDPSQEDPLESKARQIGVSYVKLDGTIGCMVNGAGLAMATLDLVRLAGGEPANFLDVGGGASEEQIKHSLLLLAADPNVKSIFINIFGGILRCDRLARGLVSALSEAQLRVPIVVRLQGTNLAEGKLILEQSGLNLELFEDPFQAAKRAVELASGR